MTDSVGVGSPTQLDRLTVITTEDGLHSNEWPMGTVIQEIHHDGDGCAEKFCDFYQPLWEMAFQCGWTRAGKMYDPDDDSPRLPCRLLWHPEWSVGHPGGES